MFPPLGRACLLVLAATALPSSGQSIWTGAADKAYDNPLNWSPANVPGDQLGVDETARFDSAGSHTVSLPAGAAMAPFDLEVAQGAVTLQPVALGAAITVRNELAVSGTGELMVDDGVQLFAPRTELGADAGTTTSLEFRDGASAELGDVRVGVADTAGSESLVTVFQGAQVQAADVAINTDGGAQKTAVLQVIGEFSQTGNATTTIGSPADNGTALLAASSGGVFQSATGAVTVRGAGSILSIGGDLRFGGDLLLETGAAYTENLGSGAVRSFAPNSSVAVNDGAAAQFDTAAVMLADGQALSIEGPSASVATAGDVVLGAQSVLELTLDSSVQMTSDIPSSSLAPMLTVGGVFSQAGEIRVNVSGPAPEPGDALPLVSAASGFAGGFGSTLFPVVPGVGWNLQTFGGTLWLTAVEAQPGDYNGDAVVDAADYAVWRNSVAAGAPIGSYQEWRANYGAGVSGSASGVSAPTPEPGGAWLTCLLALIAGCRPRR